MIGSTHTSSVRNPRTDARHRRLGWLVAIAAVGTTSMAPPSEAPVDTPPFAALPSVSAPPPMPVAAPWESRPTDSASADANRERVDEIADRLAERHTSMSERERHAVAHTILDEALKHDLQPELVIAVIEVESSGYPMAVSSVGARGLMQLMPATAEELAPRIGIEWSGPDLLFDPQVNIRLGTRYLRQLVDKYGSVTVALAAYNWGPGAIDRRIAAGRHVPSRYIEQVMTAYAAKDTGRS